MNYLGLDYGLAHIGIALAETSLATPLPPVHNNEHLLSRLKDLVKEYSVAKIVCGVPEGRLVPVIENFAKELESFTGVEVVLHPETLSTQEALQKLKESGASRAKRQNDHSYAACLILEDYLEFQK